MIGIVVLWLDPGDESSHGWSDGSADAAFSALASCLVPWWRRRICCWRCFWTHEHYSFGHMSTALELAEELAVSDRTIRRAVDRELIRARRPSPNKLEIAPEERDYVVGHWSLLQDLVSALRTEPSVEAAILYGSTARGDDDESSDVDLLVALRPDTQLRPRDLRMRLESVVGRDVDVVALDQAVADPSHMLDVLRDGRPLVDRGGQWARLRRKRSAFAHEAVKRQSEGESAAAVAWAELAS